MRRALILGGAALTAVVLAVAPSSAVSSGSARPSRETDARRAVIGFISAFNRHDARAALAFFTSDRRFLRSGANDCDFRKRVTVGFHGRAEVARWLRLRAADHDQLVLADIRLLPTRTVSVAGAALTYSRRSSDTLTALGFPDGINPNGTKIGFTTRGPLRFTQFANASGIGKPCEP